MGSPTLRTSPSGWITDETNGRRRSQISPVGALRPVRHEEERVPLAEEERRIRVSAKRVTGGCYDTFMYALTP